MDSPFFDSLLHEMVATKTILTFCSAFRKKNGAMMSVIGEIKFDRAVKMPERKKLFQDIRMTDCQKELISNEMRSRRLSFLTTEPVSFLYHFNSEYSEHTQECTFLTFISTSNFSS